MECKEQGMVSGMKVDRGASTSSAVFLRLGSGELEWAGLLESKDQDISEDIWIKLNSKNP